MKLSKMQVQAIISKLTRESEALREELIEEAKKNYIPSENVTKLTELLERRDKLRDEVDKAVNEAKKLAKSVGIEGVYTYTKTDEILNKLIDKELECKYPKINIEEALDDLIISTSNENFSVDNFIESYLIRLKNE